MDHLQPRFLQQQQMMMQSPQASLQLQLHQKLLLQAHQNLPSPRASDLERSKLLMLLNEQNFGSDGVGLQVGQPALSHGDLDVLIKVNIFL